MPENIDHGKTNHTNSERVEALIEYLYSLSHLAAKREIAHALNNSLTPLSIQHAMLTRAIQSGDTEKALARVETIGQALKKIAQFSESLMTTNLIPFQMARSNINELVKEVLLFAASVPSIVNVKCRLDLCSEVESILVDPNMIGAILMWFLKQMANCYEHPLVVIKTKWDMTAKICQLQIHTPGESKATFNAHRQTLLQNSGAVLGGIPFERLRRIICSVYRGVELTTLDSIDEPSIVLTIPFER
jgi:hypothetical protein